MSADTNNLSRGLAKGAAEIESFSSQIQGLGGRLSGVFTGLGTALAGIGVANFLQSAVVAASDLNEQVSKSQQVFGAASAIVEADAKRMAEAFGVPRREFLEAASNIGLIAEGAGLSEAAAAKLGSQFAQLGVDVSSFFNVRVDEALDALRSGLVGESEPLRRFGVLLNEDAVKAEAARLGIAALGTKLSEAAKVQARVSLITQGLTKATGDMARTASGAANQMRSVSGRMEELKVAAGQAIAPVTSAFLDVANVGVKAISEAVLRNKGEIEAWAASAAENLKGLTDGTGDLGAAMEIIGTIGRGVALVFRAIETAGADLVNGIAEKFQWLQGAMESAFSLVPGVEFSRGPFWDALRDEATALRDKYAQATADIWNGTQRATTAIKEQAVAVKQLASAAPALAPVTKAIDDQAAAAKKVSDDMAKVQARMVADAQTLTEKFRTPLESYRLEVAKIQTLAGKGLITPEVAGRGLKAAAEELNAPAIEARKALEEQAKSVKESIQTPAEKLAEERQKLSTLLSAGLINPAEFGRALDLAKKEVGDTGFGVGIDTDTKFAGAVELGSLEARSAILAHRTSGAGDPLKSIDRTGKDQLHRLDTLIELTRQGVTGGDAFEILSFT